MYEASIFLMLITWLVPKFLLLIFLRYYFQYSLHLRWGLQCFRPLFLASFKSERIESVIFDSIVFISMDWSEYTLFTSLYSSWISGIDSWTSAFSSSSEGTAIQFTVDTFIIWWSQIIFVFVTNNFDIWSHNNMIYF